MLIASQPRSMILDLFYHYYLYSSTFLIIQYSQFRRKYIYHMDEVSDDEEVVQITIKSSITPKFFKQLNDKLRKSKKKIKDNPITPQKMEMLEKVGGLSTMKNSRKLPEVTLNGNRIFAHWKNDQIYGQAEIHYHNGVIFKGIYQNGVKVKGHFKFLNGYEYIGNCLGNTFNGQGSLIFPSGKIITGQWKEYALDGNGKIEYPHGEVYYGEIQNFKKHGKGYLFLRDGSKYVGEFKQGMINGNGTYYVDDNPVSKGVWSNGQLVKSVDLEIINEETFEFNELDDKAQQIQMEIRRKSSLLNETKDVLAATPTIKPTNQKENKSSQDIFAMFRMKEQPPTFNIAKNDKKKKRDSQNEATFQKQVTETKFKKVHFKE